MLGQVRSTQRHDPHVRDEEEKLVVRIIELATQYGIVKALGRKSLAIEAKISPVIGRLTT